MGEMNAVLVELDAYREATRVRLSPKALQALRDHAEMYDAFMGDEQPVDADDKLVANGLAVLLAMYDKIEGITRGQA